MEPPKKALKTARNLLLLLLMFISDISGSDWSYKGSLGPDFWHQVFTDCSGAKQSPINIITQDTVYDPNLTEFAIWFNPPHPQDHMIVINNGHTVKVKTVGKFYIANGGLPNVYKTAQLHFHWGLADNQGSEHQIDSASYPLELHIVNYDHYKYSSLSEAMTKPLGLAVLGVMFKVTEKDNPALKPIIDVIEEIQKPGHPKIKINAQSMKVFLPEDTSKFYRYNGSLTTPGCYETVIWTIFKQANYISHGQMKKLRELFYNKEFGGHPHHQEHHHDHDKLMQEALLALESKENSPTLASAEENKNPAELPKPHIEDKTEVDQQPHPEENPQTPDSEIPSDTTKEEANLDESVAVPIAEEAEEVAAVKADQLPEETPDASGPKPQGSPTVGGGGGGEEEAVATVPEMQMDASYVHPRRPDGHPIAWKRQHGKHKKHHHHHHHHVSKRHAEGQATPDDHAAPETKKDVSDGSQEEGNYLVEGDHKLDAIEEEIRQSAEIYEEIKHKIETVNIIDNYRPVQPLNDRIVLRSFQSFKDKSVSYSGYGVPKYVHSKAETIRGSTTRIGLIVFITFTINLLSLA